MKPIHAAIFALFVPALSCCAFEPPFGIPDPAETWPGFGEIDRVTPSWPASWLASQPAETAGFYFIDNSDPNATNTNNIYGYPGKPRVSIPEGQLPGGTFIYIHGGTYTATTSAGDRYDWSGVGSASSPIWITGNPTAKPVFQELVHIGLGAAGETDYLVLENLNFTGTSGGSIRIQPTVDGVRVRHVLIRNVKVQHLGVAADSGGILVGTSTSSDTVPNSIVEDVVAYQNDISYCGDRLTTDTAGFYNGYHTNRIWCIDNLIHHVGADSVAGSHYSNDTTQRTTNYFIGRNVMYGNGENGIDIKGANGVIISQNTIYGPFEREQGGAIVLHYGASPPTKVKNCAVLFNRVYHCSGGVGTGSSYGCDDLTVIGNLFYDISNSYAATSDPLNGACIQLGGSSGRFYIANNTFHSYEKGIYVNSLHTGDDLRITANIFSTRSSSAQHDIYVATGEQLFVRSDYNCFTTAPRFFWGGALRTLAYMKTTAGVELNSLEADPAFIAPGAGDFSVTAFSPCIDHGIKSDGYSAFETYFGRDIAVDYNGLPRPYNSLWDIGAFETIVKRPQAPTNLRVLTP